MSEIIVLFVATPETQSIHMVRNDTSSGKLLATFDSHTDSHLQSSYFYAKDPP
jgi:hypothetical protein